MSQQPDKPATWEELETGIKMLACVEGRTKSDLLELAKKEIADPELFNRAEKFIWLLFEGRERMPRKLLRANRINFKMTFSTAIRKKLK